MNKEQLLKIIFWFRAATANGATGTDDLDVLVELTKSSEDIEVVDGMKMAIHECLTINTLTESQ